MVPSPKAHPAKGERLLCVTVSDGVPSDLTGMSESCQLRYCHLLRVYVLVSVVAGPHSWTPTFPPSGMSCRTGVCRGADKRDLEK